MYNLLYDNYKLSLKILSLINNKNTKKLYEFKNIVERFLLNRANLVGYQNTFSPIDDRLSLELLDKMAAELKIKKIKVPIESIKSIFDRSSGILQSSSSDQDEEERFTTPAISNKYIVYKRFKYRMNNRLKLLIRRKSIEEVTGLILRYSSMLSGGQQWAMPSELMTLLHSKYRFRYEGFASPLNSVMLGLPGGRYCSLFTEDRAFGSIGSFNSEIMISNGGYNWIVNPPYTEYMLSYAVESVLHALNHVKINVVMLTPHWLDADYYTLLQKSPYTKHIILLKKNEHIYEDKKSTIVAKFNSQLIILSSKPTNCDGLVEDIKEFYKRRLPIPDKSSPIKSIKEI